MDQRRASEVSEVHAVKPARAPFPGANDRVDHTGEEHAEDQERQQLDTTSNRTGNDGAACGGEHGLEEEVRPYGVAGVVRGADIARRAVAIRFTADTKAEGEVAIDNPVVTGVHDQPATHAVHHDADHHDHHVLEQDVDGVLSPGQAGFNTGKTQVHDEDKHARDHDPEVVRLEVGEVVDSGCW